jgi:outer membrane protein assembly factor BamB/protocatechuate 3,4-dioxygenase beta subunit
MYRQEECTFSQGLSQSRSGCNSRGINIFIHNKSNGLVVLLVRTLSKTRCLLYIIAALFFSLAFLMSGCGGQDVKGDVQSASSSLYTGYVFAPSSLPSALSCEDYPGDKMIVLTVSKPPAGYRPVEGASIVSSFEPDRILAFTNASGMFQLDLESLKANSRSGDSLSRLTDSIIVLPPSGGSRGLLEKTLLHISDMKKNSETIKKLIIAPATRVVFEGESVQLKAMAVTSGSSTRIVTPSEVTWTISSGNAASITPAGVIKGLKAGVVTVMISSGGVTSTGRVLVIGKLNWCMLNGTVLDENGKPVKGAVVTVEEVEGVDITNAAGKFLIKKIPTDTDLTITVEVNGVIRYTNIININKVMNFITIKLSGEQAQSGNIEGIVTSGGIPLQGVMVSAETFSDVTDVNGRYRIEGLTPRTYTFAFEKVGYEKAESPQTITAGETVVLNVDLTQIPQPTTGALDGYVLDHAGNPVSGADVSYSLNNQFPGTGSTTSDANGFFSFAEVLPGSYRIQADKEGYNAGYTDATVVIGQTTSTEIVLHSLASIQVSPINPSIANGYTMQFFATGLYTDNSSRDLTSDVTWYSSNPQVASVSNETADKGLAKSLATGSTQITAKLQGVTSSPSVLTVTTAELLSIHLTPTVASIAKGYNRQFTATGMYSDNTTKDITNDVTWHSSNVGVAIISNQAGSQGLAISVDTGTTEIRASYNTITSPTAVLTVTPAELVSVQVDPPNPSVAKGYNIQFIATGIFSDNSSKDITDSVTWTSSNETVANISNDEGTKGLSSTWKTGETDIKASASGITSPASRLTVTAAVLVSMQVEPVNPTVAKGYNCQFSVTGMYSDMTTKDLTADVTWFSSAPGVASVSNAADSKGLAYTLATGTTKITAYLDGITSTESILTVTPAVLVSLQVEPVNPSIAKGYSCQFSAVGTYSDLTTQNLTADVTWYSSVPGVAVISNVDESKGLATSVSTGSTAIKAVKGQVESSPVTLTVTPAVLLSISIDPTDASIPLGYKQQFKASGTYSDNSVQNITGDVTWFSSTNNASISNVEGQKGLATSLKVGSAAITAVLDDITSPAAALTITPAILESISISPGDVSIVKGFSQQFAAEGTYSDGTTSELTQEVTWTSSFTDVAVISNSAGTKGLAVSTGTGETDIMATLSGINSPVSVLTVTPAQLVSMKLTPLQQTMGLGKTHQFSAEGTFTDQTTRDITGEVTWSSSDASVASISNNADTKGLATSVNKGLTTIKAAYASTQIQAEAVLAVETPKWISSVGSDAYSSSSPAIGADGTIYVGSSNLDKSLNALHPDGTIKWKYTGNGGIFSSATIGADGTIYVGSQDTRLYAINEYGTSLWSYKTNGEVRSSPAIGDDGTIYVGSADGKLYALKPDGTLKWSYATGDSIYSSPAIGGLDGTIYFTSYDYHIYALTPDGELKWKFQTGSHLWSSPAIGNDGIIYAGSLDGFLYAIYPDGIMKWRYGAGGDVYSSPVIDVDGTIYTGSNDGRLHAVNSDGIRKWRFQTGASIDICVPAIGSDGVIYIGSSDKVFYAITSQGELKWSYALSKSVSASPAIAPDGTILAFSGNGNLYAFYSSAPLANSAWPMFQKNPMHTGRQ